MATVITAASSKGGAGKSTIARLLLGHAVLRGRRAAAIDADINRSLFDWCARSSLQIEARAEPDETRIIQTVAELQGSADLIVIDCAGSSNQSAVFAIGVADLVIVPLRLSGEDFVEAAKTVRLIRSAAAMSRRDIPARLVLNGFKPRTAVAAHVEREIATAGLPVMKTRLHDLVGFVEMSFSGHVPTDGLAGLQAAELFEEVMSLCGASPAALRLAS